MVRRTGGWTDGLHSRTLAILRASSSKTAIDGLEATLLAGTSLRRLADVTSAPGWTLVEARDINERGDIVGWGTTGGIAHAFLLSTSSNTPPLTRDDEVAVASEAQITIRVLDNDEDADGNVLRLVRVGDPAIGTARLSDDSTSVIYEAGRIEGIDVFSYTATDGAGSSATSTIRVVVAKHVSPGRAQIISRYPNPATAELSIVFSASDSGPAHLEIFDLLGRVVRRITLQDVTAGIRTVTLSTERLGPGAYVARLRHGKDVDTMSFVVAR